MPHVKKSSVGHRLEPAACHFPQSLVSQICRRCLDRVYASLGVVKCHRPVVGDSVHDIGKACVDGCLCRPDVRCDERYVLWKILYRICHKLGIFLIHRIIGKLLEHIVVHRLPHDFIEHTAFLRDPRTQRIKLVLLCDYLCTGRSLQRAEIKPVRDVPKLSCRRSHRHGDTVMTKAHSYISDYHCIVGKSKLICVRKIQFLHAKAMSDDRVLLCAIVICPCTVITKLFNELRLAVLSLSDNALRHLVSENNTCAIHYAVIPFCIALWLILSKHKGVFCAKLTIDKSVNVCYDTDSII